MREARKPAKNADMQEDIIAAAKTAVCDKDFSITPPNNPPKMTALAIIFIVICCDFSFLTKKPPETIIF